MTALALNNLWTYIESLSLKRKDREWLAGKLLEQTEEDAKSSLLRNSTVVSRSWQRSINHFLMTT